MPATLRHQELVEFLDRVGFAHRADVRLGPPALNIAGGQLRVLPLNRLDHVVGRQVVAGQLLGIDPDTDIAGLQAAELHAAHVRNGGDLLFEFLLGEVADLVQRNRAGKCQPHHGQVIRIDFRDHRRVDVLRQSPASGRDGVLHVLHRHVDAARQPEVDRDDAGPLQALRHDVIDALDAGDRILDHVGHVAVHDVRRRRLAGDDDVHHREVDLRKLADAHVPVAEIAKDDHRRRQHDGEDGVLDADVGEGHGGEW